MKLQLKNKSGYGNTYGVYVKMPSREAFAIVLVTSTTPILWVVA